MSQPTPPKQFKYSESDKEFPPGDLDDKPAPSSGLKIVQPGDDYQLLLLCLCLWRVLKNKIFDFHLATELPEAEKFDDVVIKYKHEDRTVLRFLQAKHKEEPRPPDSIHKITLTDLLTSDASGDFSLLKYFRSIVKILGKRYQNPVPAFLEEADIQEFILSTNIDLAEEVEEYFEVDDEDPLEKDKVLGVPTEQTRKLKIKKSDNELTRELGILLRTCSDFDELVEKIADCLLLQQRFDETSRLFEVYYYPLVKDVLEFEFTKGNKICAKLSDNFKGANSQRTDEVEDFREALMKEIAFRRSDYKILVNISTSTGSSSSPQSDTNRKWKTSTDDSKLTKELKEFVDQLKVAMYPANSNLPNGTGLTPALFKDMTLFKEVVDDKKGKFCDDFMSNPKKLSPKAKLLRKMLIDEVVDGALAEDEFDEVSGETFPTTEGYATRFQPKSNVEIEDVEGFAKDIADLIGKCRGNTIEITDVVGTEQFRKNIIEVAGHAIVKVSSGFEFSGNFIRYSRGRPLGQFREALIKRLGEKKFDSIGDYSLDIKLKDFTSCEETMLHRTLPNPVTKKLIDDFYENFRLIVSYPNRKGLRELLEFEVKAENQLLNSKAFVDSLVQEIHQWMTHRLGPFYTLKKAQALLRRLDGNLFCYELDEINQPFFQALPTKYKFKCEDLMTLIKDFLQQTQSNVLLLHPENVSLCHVRFLQAFSSLQEQNQSANGELPFYLHRFGYVFMTTDQLQYNSFWEKLISRNQDKDRWNLRVVEWQTESLPGPEKSISFSNLLELWVHGSMLDLRDIKNLESMLDLLFESSDSPSVARKVIFIVRKDTSKKLRSALDSYFKKQGNKNFKPSTFELKTTFSDLEPSSQDELLKNEKITLNGHDYQFGDIVNQDTVRLIRERAFVNLIEGSNSNSIGEKIKHSDYRFKGRLKASIRLLKKEGEEGRDIVIVADSKDEFNEIKDRLMEDQKHFAPRSIHWVREGKHFIAHFPWDSIKSLSSLHRYGTKACFLPEEKFLESVKDKKIVILHGVPGDGTAVLLENISINMTDNSLLHWKIYINLKRYTDFFNKRQNEEGNRANMSSSECSEFLLELLQSNTDTKLDSQLEINFLRSAFQLEIAGKIRLVLFMDGFDEISPNYKDIVLNFLLSSKTCSGALQMFIITRSENYEYLEEKLQTLSLRCDAVSDTDKNSL